MLPKEIDALKRACIYSIPPNKLGYCGPDKSWKTLNSFISNPTKQNAEAAKHLLTNFNALYPYLELIADANSLEPFDAEVIEAYWIGNQLLENVSCKQIQKTIISFQNFGLPKSIAKKKASELPDGMLPHHSMHVLYINFISQKVEPIVKNLSNCLVQWAKVLEETPKGIRVKGIELFLESAELKLREKEKIVHNPFNLALKPNDIVTVHWSSSIEIVTEQKQKLESYTFKNLNTLSLLGKSNE